jgi:hypothetical protein
MPNQNKKFSVLYRTEEEIKIYEAKKKKEIEAKEQIKKEAAKIPEKKFFDVKLDALVPCTITYRVFAENENDALLNIDKQTPRNVKPDVRRKKNIKAIVCDAGSNIAKLTKAYRI